MWQFAKRSHLNWVHKRQPINHGFSTFATLSASGFFVYGLRRFAQLLLIVKYINWEIIYNNAISPICTTKFNLLISLENVYFQSKM
jgi:hypothetical protein